MFCFVGIGQRQRQADFVRQIVTEAQGIRSPSSNFLPDGENAGHFGRVSTNETFSIPSKFTTWRSS